MYSKSLAKTVQERKTLVLLLDVQTRGGRYLRVIYVPDPSPDSVFVITAYALPIGDGEHCAA
ncbi:MAG: hypothetical protein SVY10_20490 [Thermodesulfobacteriota bacterium]|nr:hypothetical protein [Thermodesulfobacteriota bacterium]